MPQEEPLDQVVRARVRRSEKAQMQESADRAGLTLSEFMRRRSLGKPIISRTDEQMIRDLRRIGGLLKKVNNDSGGAYTSTVVEALGAVGNFIEQLSRETDDDRQED
ncbi:MAG: hypothetical protein SFW36_23920 [Leptolyngbyaceae cyanobacterium bins.59]|nr:hypothetical protein [Leptolyngbyaceae cyanobacterium bins.59]